MHLTLRTLRVDVAMQLHESGYVVPINDWGHPPWRS